MGSWHITCFPLVFLAAVPSGHSLCEPSVWIEREGTRKKYGEKGVFPVVSQWVIRLEFLHLKIMKLLKYTQLDYDPSQRISILEEWQVLMNFIQPLHIYLINLRKDAKHKTSAFIFRRCGRIKVTFCIIFSDLLWTESTNVADIQCPVTMMFKSSLFFL